MAGGILIGTLAVIGFAVAANGTDGQGTATGNEEAGKLLFSDDFSTSKSGWTTYSKGSLLAAYKNGSYILTAVPANYWSYNFNPRLNLTDFIVEVEATKVSGPDDNVFGLAFRRRPGYNLTLSHYSLMGVNLSRCSDDRWTLR